MHTHYCQLCDEPMENTKGQLHWNDPFVGSFVVHNVQFSNCPCCGNTEFPLETAETIDAERTQLLDALIRQHPIDDFVSLNQAASMLEITKQAFSKHRRISAGFIFSTQIDGKSFFLRKSVTKFKKEGDGRYLLLPLQTAFDIEYFSQTQNVSTQEPDPPTLTIYYERNENGHSRRKDRSVSEKFIAA